MTFGRDQLIAKLTRDEGMTLDGLREIQRLGQEIDAPDFIPVEPIPHDLDRAAYYIPDVAGWDKERAVELFRWLLNRCET